MRATVASDTGTLIVGAGYAGLAVASKLDASTTTIVDRGLPFDPAETRRHFRMPLDRLATGDLGALVEAEARVMQSPNSRDRIDLPLSILSANVYSYRQGGISNWWGGYCKRITPECFAQDGVLSWPDEVGTLDKYYAHAEQLLRVHGDPKRTNATSFAPMPGWNTWRSYLGQYFPGCHVTNEAKNVTDRSRETAMGLCTGNGHCAICANDAKARPSATFPTISVVGDTMVNEIVFDKGRAVSARCESDGERFSVTFDRIVLASGGIENVALLRRSSLPNDTPRALIGRHYQDHTAAEILVRMSDPIPYFNIGAECHTELPDISGFYHGLEVKCLFLSVPPSHDLFNTTITASIVDHMNTQSGINQIGRIYLQVEIPPEWDLRIRSRGTSAYLYTMPYYQKLALLDAVVLDVAKRISEKGLLLERIVPHYRYAFGGHHYSGVTPMTKGDHAVVSPDHLLLGTSNVYLSGASVMPRCGSAGPTLSIVAMGLRLGDILTSSQN